MLKPYNKTELFFDIVSELGNQGQNSRTYLVQDHQLNAQIVAKQIEKKGFKDPSGYFSEAQALYASAHPNVVQIHYACQDSDYIYMAMPFYAKGSVKSYMAANALTAREIVTIGCQVLNGLHHIHSKKLIHFDIKPDNILLSDRGEGLLSDFGLAKIVDLNGLASQSYLYSRMMPPEVWAANTSFDRTFDIFEMGLTLYRMCNGEANFEFQFRPYMKGKAFDISAFSAAVQAGQFPDRRAFAPHIPSRLRKVIKKCMEIKKTDRYQSALDAMNNLGSVDENLDWRFSVSHGSRVWKKNKEGTSYELTVSASGESKCYKTTMSGNRTRVLDGCRKSMPEKDLTTFLKDH